MAEDLSGIAPPDYNTDIGQLRAIIPDVSWAQQVPPVAGIGDYVLFGDTILGVFLSRTNNDVDAAALIAWSQIADSLIMQATTVTTDDLRVSLEKRAELYYKKVADAKKEYSADIFVLAPVGESCACSCHAELSPWPCESCSCRW